MKNISFILIFIIFMGCSNKEKTFLDDFVVSLNIDTTFFIFTQNNNYGIYAKMTDANKVSGFGNNFNFNIDITNYEYNKKKGSISGYELYNNFQEITTLSTGEKSGLYLRKSKDGGATYTTLFSYPSSVSYSYWPYMYNGYLSSETGYFNSPDNGWIFSYFESSHNPDTGIYQGGTRVYKVDGSAITLLSRINKTYYPIQAHFENSQNGILLVEKKYQSTYLTNFFFYKTSNGGNSWFGPYPLNGFDPYNTIQMRYLNTGKYLFFNNYTNGKIITTLDDGLSFSTIEINSIDPNASSFTDFYVINENLIYAALITGNAYGDTKIGKIYKSNDQAKTWQIVSKKEIYVDKIHFYDYLHGIAVSKNYVQVTNDGGQTWKLLIYPKEK